MKIRFPGSVLLLSFLVLACTEERPYKPLPAELTRDHACSVCGMIIVDFPGAKGQIHYKNGKIDRFCSTLDLFVFYNQPDRPANIAAIFVNDMGKADRNHLHTYWTDAQKAFYVYGGDVMGPMGEALVPFSEKEAAGRYIKEHGGRIVSFGEVTMEMLRPDVHDH